MNEHRPGFDIEGGGCSCGGQAVRRTNRKTGKDFYGCSKYPECKNAESLDASCGYDTNEPGDRYDYYLGAWPL